RARPEPDGHPLLDEQRGRFGGEPLLPDEPSRHAHGSPSCHRAARHASLWSEVGRGADKEVRMSTVETLVGRIGWHELVTPNVEQAKEFYGKLLGWETEVFKPGEVDYTVINVNGRGHGGFLPSEQAGGAPPHWLAYVHVENAADIARRAKSAGGSVMNGPMDIPEVGTIVVIGDPQGAVIAAISGTPDSDMPVPEGVFVWDELST